MAKKDTFDYSVKMGELESIVSKLQDTETPLDEAIALHEQGKKLAGELEKFLKTAEHDIHKQVSKE